MVPSQRRPTFILRSLVEQFEALVDDIMYVGKLAVAPDDLDPVVVTAFRKHDTDASGDICTNELHEVLKELSLDVDAEYTARVLQKYDTDNNGTLSLSELDALYKDAFYANALSVPPPKEIDALVLTAFRKHDADGSGDLSTKELFAMLREMGVDQDTPHAQKILASYDSDGNGSLSLTEFGGLFKDLMNSAVGDAPAEVTPEVLASFRKYDQDTDGFMDASELEKALKDMGLEVEANKVAALVESFSGTAQLNLKQFAEAVRELSF